MNEEDFLLELINMPEGECIESFIDRLTTHQSKSCAFCGKAFTWNRVTRRFCSDKCRIYKWRKRNALPKSNI